MRLKSKNGIVLIGLIILSLSFKADAEILDKDVNKIIDTETNKTLTFDEVLTKKEENLLQNLKSYKDLSYLSQLEKAKNEYLFDDILNLSDDYSFVETGYQHDQSAIDSKVKELQASQAKAILLGTVEEIDNIILQNSLMDAFGEWSGVKYKWGGDSKSGIDCSALVRRIYRAVFGYELPRVSTSQVTRGYKVNKSDLKPGDILFFTPENRTNHTAVYIGNSLFINASTSKGVVLSSLDNDYWGKYFKYGVRVEAARTQE